MWGHKGSLSDFYQQHIRLWKRSGLSSFNDWMESKPGEVRLARRTVGHICSWIHRKHQADLNQPPLSLLALGDCDADPGVKAKNSLQWDGMNKCCVRDGCARQFKDRQLSSKDMVADADNLCMLRTWPLLIKGTIADVEVRHKRLEQQLASNGLSRFSTVCCQFTNAECQSAHVSKLQSICDSRLAGPSMQRQKRQRKSVNKDGGTATRKRKEGSNANAGALSAIHLFRTEHQEEYGSGKYSKADWQVVKADFARLPLAQQNDYQKVDLRSLSCQVGIY